MSAPVWLCAYVGLCALDCNAHGSQKRELDPLEMEWHATVSYLTWSWELNLSPLEEHQVSALNHRPNSEALNECF